MSEIKTETKTKKTKKKMSASALVLMVGLIIIAIPCIVFGLMLLIPAMQTGSPRDGNRFANDLSTAITNDQVSSLKSELSSMSDAEDVDVILMEGQLRIYVDVKDSLDSAGVDRVLEDTYNKVNAKLPVSKYFTKTGNEKMYDLNINVYTSSEDKPNREWKLLHKNSSEAQYGIDDIAHPKDEKLVAELRGELAPSSEEPAADTAEGTTTE